jgi:hypothetical protein
LGKNWIDDNFGLLSNGDDCSRVADPSVSNFVLSALELWITIEWKFPFNLLQIYRNTFVFVLRSVFDESGHGLEESFCDNAVLYLWESSLEGR